MAKSAKPAVRPSNSWITNAIAPVALTSPSRPASPVPVVALNVVTSTLALPAILLNITFLTMIINVCVMERSILWIMERIVTVRNIIILTRILVRLVRLDVRRVARRLSAKSVMRVCNLRMDNVNV